MATYLLEYIMSRQEGREGERRGHPLVYLLSSASSSSSPAASSSYFLSLLTRLSKTILPQNREDPRARSSQTQNGKKKRKAERYFLARFWERRGHSRPPDTAPAGSRPPASMCNLLALHSNPHSSSRYCICCRSRSCNAFFLLNL